MGRSICLTVLCLTLASVTGRVASAPSENPTESVSNSAVASSQTPSSYDAEIDWRVHTVGDIFAKIGNNGSFGGRQIGSAADPDSGSGHIAAFYFRENAVDHLFNGGLWIGGLIGTDTMVAGAVYAGSQTSAVFQPTRRIETNYSPGLGHQSFTTEYIVNPNFESFAPVGLQVRQVSHQFASRPYDRFVLVEYIIHNVSDHPFENIHAGLFIDADIASAYDDLTGFLRPEGIAYSVDNDKQPRMSAFGLAPVQLDPQPCCTTFNWWATNHSDIWWGPNRTNIERSEMQTPAGMYRVMANQELDYDQWFAGTDSSSTGWNLPPSDSVAMKVGAGMDTRWTLSYEFGDLLAGDSIRLVMALAVGDSVRGPAGTPIPAGLDLTQVVRNVELARFVWNNNFNLENASPTRLTVTAISDSTVQCEWTSAPYMGVSGYRLFRKWTRDTAWTVVATLGSETMRSVDYPLTPGRTYEYSVASIDQDGVVGSRSRSTRVTLGYPRAAPNLSGRNMPAGVGLNWTIPESPEGYAPYKWISIRRRNDADVWGEFGSSADYRVPLIKRRLNGQFGAANAPLLPDEFGMKTFDFVDNNVDHAASYSYRVSLTNALGLEGPWSSAVEVTPMKPRFDGVVLLGTNGGRRSLINADSSQAFYSQWAETMGFRVWNAVNTFPPFRTLAYYRCAVVVMEDINAIFPGRTGEAELETYLANGGRVVFIARNHSPVDASSSPHPLLQRFLGISKTYVETPWEDHFLYDPPEEYIVARFTHAIPQISTYPTLEGDSAAAWSIGYWNESAQGVDSVYAAGFVPAIGAVDSLAPGTEIVYTYQSAYDTSFFQDKPIVVRRITDSTAAILFNFPLSLMNHEQAWQVLTQAVADLGIDTNGYTPPSTQSSVRNIVDYLYGRASVTPNPAWDVNRDGRIDIRDVAFSTAR